MVFAVYRPALLCILVCLGWSFCVQMEHVGIIALRDRQTCCSVTFYIFLKPCVNDLEQYLFQRFGIITMALFCQLACVYNDHSLYVWDWSNIDQIGKVYSALFHSACIWDVDVSESAHPQLVCISCTYHNTVLSSFGGNWCQFTTIILFCHLLI